jgi:hypothetical protein
MDGPLFGFYIPGGNEVEQLAIFFNSLANPVDRVLVQELLDSSLFLKIISLLFGFVSSFIFRFWSFKL